MSAPGPIEAVLFDALGTLIELRPPGSALRRGLRERHRVAVTQAEAERALIAEMAYYRSHNHRAADPEGLAELRRECTQVLRAELPPAARDVDLAALTDTLLAALRFEPYPDVRGALAALRDHHVRRVIVSNWDISLHRVLADTGLADLVDGVVTSAEVGFAKPKPQIFAAALELAGTAPERALHVGDSTSEDIEGARAAGIRPVLLDRSASASPASGPDDGITIASLSELPALVEGLSRAP